MLTPTPLIPIRPWRRFCPSQCRLCHSTIAPRWTPSDGHDSDGAHASLLDYGVMCRACLETFYQTHAPPALHAPVPGLDYVAACVVYRYPWDQLLIAFKLQQQAGLAAFLAALLQLSPDVQEVLQQAEVLLPMPLHPSRLAERGYNQSTLLARALPQVAGSSWWAQNLVWLAPKSQSFHKTSLRLDTQSLLRARATAPQRHLNARERLDNLRHAFVLDPVTSPSLSGKHIVLLDDILTTGTSLTQCAQTLANLGCASISAVVVARALLASRR